LEIGYFTFPFIGRFRLFWVTSTTFLSFPYSLSGAPSLMRLSILQIALALLLTSFMGNQVLAQQGRGCGTMEYLDAQMQSDPTLATRMAQEEFLLQQRIQNGLNSSNKTNIVYTIPVVVHVIWNNNDQNISDAQIQSQIDVLNEDFRRNNADKINTPSVFLPVAADAEINFCLASRDPNGAATTGITRTFTNAFSFNGQSSNTAIKTTAGGGRDPWPRASYLNIWVCNLGGGLLGYAQFPGGTASTDGVVINYSAFGRNGTAQSPYDLGRTGTHEVGHWLNLRHIWGDSNCGNDLVADTPTQQDKNYGCPSFPQFSCGNTGNANSEMFMNYMDYCNDNCLNTFTLGQKSRMQAVLATGGQRASLANSLGCLSPSATCQGQSTFSTTSGTVTDGSGAASYSNNLNCSFLIQPAGATSISLTFTAFSTEATNDVVRVYNGATTGAPLLGTYSGSNLPAVLNSTGGSMLITFTTNASVTSTGWSANYTSSLNTFCGNSTLTAAFGNFTDGSGTSNYKNNTNCAWLIQPPNAQKITLSFTSFATESGYDFVRVYRGTTTAAPLAATYSGSTLPTALTVNGNSMLVVFTSDTSINAAGWAAKYETVTCGFDSLTAQTDTITDGSGNSDYGNLSDCTWLIRPAGAHTITLNFLDFATELDYDTLFLYDGGNTNWPLLGAFTGTTLPPTLTSTNGRMFLRFKSDELVTAAGFRAVYTTNLVNQCSSSTTLSAPSGTFGDGSGAANYQNNVECRWLIAPVGATSITLNFSAFATENGYDSVYVYNGTTTTGTSLGKFTGTNLPSSVTSTTGAMLVIFRSDYAVSDQGFTASYTSNGVTTPYCTGTTTLTSTTGTVDDGSGSSDYYNNTNCSWLIQPTGANYVQLTFNSFATASGADAVRVYDGTSTAAPLLGTYSGTSLPSLITSTGNALFVAFITNTSGTAAGWDATYQGLNITYCSGTTNLTTTTGSLSDGSGTTANYPNNANCRWLIQVPGASNIQLTFATPFRVASGDFVEVYDGVNASGTNLGIFSGLNPPLAVTSSGNAMYVVFTTDASTTEAGWTANYTSTFPTPFCNGQTTVVTTTGTITDGSGAASYTNNTNCSWLIQPAGANKVNLNFTQFSLGAGDNVNVYDGATTAATNLGTFNGTSLPSALSSSGSSFLVTFASDASGVGAGFSANFTSQVTAVDPLTALRGLQVYPNPTNGVLHINGELPQATSLNATLYNLLGGKVLSQQLDAATRVDGELNLGSLPQGVYLLQISNGRETVQHRIIRQ
jgi:hypothetical protein